ncbi:MAG TPA: NfeD family protein, partial [Vicinamibacterales bacterium]
RLILAVTLALSGILLVLVTLAVKAQRQPAVTGESGMLHSIADALTPIPPGGTGRVSTHGEIWTATSPEAIETGERVRVTAIRGLILHVARVKRS